MNELDLQILKEAADVLNSLFQDYYVEEAKDALALVISSLEKQQ